MKLPWIEGCPRAVLPARFGTFAMLGTSCTGHDVTPPATSPVGTVVVYPADPSSPSGSVLALVAIATDAAGAALPGHRERRPCA